MTTLALDTTRSRLLDRRERLLATIHRVSDNTNLLELLNQVDAALVRLSNGTYGICETCHKPIGAYRLGLDPLARFCSTHPASDEQKKVAEDQRIAEVALAKFVTSSVIPAELSSEWGVRLLGLAPLGETAGAAPGETDDQRELQEDLFQASNVQSRLLPKRGFCLAPWETYYDSKAARKLSGDYCDLFAADTGDLLFFFGDAVGKGIAGSMIVSHLHALFRTLLSLGLPMNQMFERANRLFCESMGTDYFATVVCGRASSDGTIELVNAGHPPPLILRSGQVTALVATGLPLGLFYISTYDVTKIQLAPGETLLFYSDGVTEARNRLDVEYGPERLTCFATGQSHLSAAELVRACVDDVTAFTSDAALSDDRTLMALRRV